MSENWRVRTRFVCDAAHDLCNIEADRMEIVDGRLQVYNRNQLVYVADVSQAKQKKHEEAENDRQRTDSGVA